jgi:hypothetical protein
MRSYFFVILLTRYAQLDGTIGISEWIDCFLHMDGSVSFLIWVTNVHRPNICISLDHMAVGSGLWWFSITKLKVRHIFVGISNMLT